MDFYLFLLKYKWIILFYAAVILFLIWKRKRLEFQAKIIILYRTLFGIKFIKKISEKYKEWVILIGYIGVGAAYVGLILISYLLIANLYSLITKPDATSGVSLVLPGVNVPGLGVLPFWYWLIGIFVIALVHEFGHGIVAKAHGLKIKNTGLVLLGPIIGAFVEPDEKNLEKQKDIVQYSIFAAGPFANIVLAGVALLLMSLVFSPLQGQLIESNGFTFNSYYGENMPAAQVGLKPGMIITGVNGVDTKNFDAFYEEMACKPVGEEIVIETKEGDFSLVTVANPDNPKKAFLGIKEIKNEFELKEKYQTSLFRTLNSVLLWIVNFLRWLFILSLGIGLFNLLPLPIVDGGRILKTTLEKISGKEKGRKWFARISLFFLLLLVLNLIFPLFGWF